MSDSLDKTILAVDYGRRRIGLAKSDPMGIIASALETLEVKSVDDGISKLTAVLEEYKPSTVVIGYPLHSSGDKSEMCEEIDAFIEKLKPFYDGPVYKVDEHGSSMEAKGLIHAHGKKVGKKKKRVDRLAAVVILQRYMNEIG